MMLFRSIRRTYRHASKGMAVFLALIAIVMPFSPVIQMPTKDEGPKLGFELSRADAAYANGYSYRRTITINESQVTGSGDLTSFPVMMNFATSTLRTTGNGGNVTDAQGDDIIFTSDAAGSTVLDFEIESYDATNGVITAWVEVPTLDFNDNTVVYMFYGNASVTTSQEDIPGTWDGASYVGVYHMDGDASTQLDSADSSVSHDGTVSGATAGATGKIGPAYDFDGTNDVITVTDEAELDVTNTGTFEAWMRTDDVNGSESNFSTWVSRAAPNGAGVNDQSGIDSVIVGENVHYGAFLCTTNTSDFAVATSSLSGSRFDNWDLSKMSATTGCGDGEGGAVAMDSDGVHIYYAALGWSGTVEVFQTATATISYSAVSTWRAENDPNGADADEGSGIGMVIVGDTAYYDAKLLSVAVDVFASTTRTIGSGAAVTWRQGTADTGPVGGGASENCANAMESDGTMLYRAVYCHDGATETYWISSSTLSSTAAPLWISQTAPNGAAANEYDGMDMTAMGGRLFHIASLHTTLTEAYLTASSTMSTFETLAWNSRKDGTNNPDGTGGVAGDSQPITLASDGKNMYYGAFIASSTGERFYTASSSLPAHPFISKRNAFEAIQVGTGFAFDWAGRPYTFGTSTNTSAFKHIVVTQDGTNLRMYENGVLKRIQQTSVDFESNANNLLIGGGNRSDGTSIWFNGVIDEVRISSGAYSADWIQTQYNNQNATSTFYTLGNESSGPPTVTTDFASNVGATSATLHGSIVVTNGSISEHGFAYSTSPTLASGVSTTTLGAGAAGQFQQGVTGLSNDQTYYFRAYANNGNDIGYGSILNLSSGNTTPTRSMRLFEGFNLKFFNGSMKLHQR